ncbi:MAG: hypothetical protein LBH13_07910 [Cellulomonadaceae bacterium]|jgi:hypothetical protein|nr:hypothetical protein [Cellulomonadaceae bacterium]
MSEFEKHGNTQVEQVVIDDDVVQLRFVDEDGQDQTIEGHLFAQSVQGLVEFVSEMGKARVFGEGPAPEVRIRPVKEGSICIEAVLEFYQANQELILTSSGAAVTELLRAGIRRWRGAVVDFEYLDNDNVKVTWKDGTASELPAKAWHEVNRRNSKARKALAKVQAPLSGDADVMEVRYASRAATSQQILAEQPELAASIDDYRATAAVDDVPEELVNYHIDVEARLRSIDFDNANKWRIAALGQRRNATIEDTKFLKKVSKGLALHDDDVFRVDIREDIKVPEAGNRTTKWTVTRVTRVNSRGESTRVSEPTSED